jgi:hypothetical protein
MSLAQDIREAALRKENQGELAHSVIGKFWVPGDRYLDSRGWWTSGMDQQWRTFALLVACALDGGASIGTLDSGEGREHG